MIRLFIGLLFLPFFIEATSPDTISPAPEDLLHQMIQQTRSVHTLEYTMRKFERFNGKMVEQISNIKHNRVPYKVYAKQKYPNDGLEILYVEGENRDRVLINPNGFPWMNVSLAPHSSQLRKGQHHTVLDTGYDLVIGILEHLVTKYNTQTDDILSISDVTSINGRNCWVLELNNPNFKYQSYTVKEGETLISIAGKFKLGEHMILEKNHDVADYWDIKAGQKIRIPNDYCPKMILTIEQDRMLPVIMEIFDEEGVYELYEFQDVIINPTFKKDEFTRSFKEYGF